MDKEAQMSLSGLPPLPKSLSAAVGGSSTSSNRASPLNSYQQSTDVNDMYLQPSTSAAARNNSQRKNRHGSLSSTQESLSDRESNHSRNSTSHSSHTPTNNNALYNESFSICSDGDVSTNTLDTQLAILRREMYGLRQLDLSLLSQLWALNESIQGFRVFLQDQDMISPPSPSSRTDSNSLSSEPEEESFTGPSKLPTEQIQKLQTVENNSTVVSHASSRSTSGTSGSSSVASSMDNNRPIPPPPLQRCHPQLPRILQQRMRHAPPPPPSKPKEPLHSVLGPKRSSGQLQRPV